MSTTVNKLQKIVNGKSGNSLVEEDDVNIRQYAKYLLKEGSTSDKRELLGNLRSRLNYKDKKITMIEGVEKNKRPPSFPMGSLLKSFKDSLYLPRPRKGVLCWDYVLETHRPT